MPMLYEDFLLMASSHGENEIVCTRQRTKDNKNISVDAYQECPI